MKTYENYIIENLSLSNNLIIDILKELKKSNNTKLIKNIIDNVDRQERSLLMNAIKSNNQDLIKFVLSFNPDVNHIDKQGKNVLYYAKNIKIINLLIDAGVNFVSTKEEPLLVFLANKKIFNIGLYKKIIDSGIVKLTDEDVYSGTVFAYLLNNKKAMIFLSSFQVKIINDEAKKSIYQNILNNYKYSQKKLSIFGLKTLITKNIIDIDCSFFKEIKDKLFSTYTENNLKNFITQLKDVISYKEFIFLDTYNNNNITGNQTIWQLLEEIYVDDDIMGFVKTIQGSNMFYRSCSYQDYLKKIRMVKAKKFNL